MTEKQKIEQEAEKLYPAQFESYGMPYADQHYQIKRAAHIAGRSAAEKEIAEKDKRIRELEGTLRNIYEFKQAAAITQDLFYVLQAIEKAEKLLNKQ